MEKKVDEILELLEAPHLAARNVNEMSSGEARRILIGRALVHSPKALVLAVLGGGGGGLYYYKSHGFAAGSTVADADSSAMAPADTPAASALRPVRFGGGGSSTRRATFRIDVAASLRLR